MQPARWGSGAAARRRGGTNARRRDGRPEYRRRHPSMARRTSLLPLLCACALLLALLPPAHPAHGAIAVTVDSELDEPDESLADGLCSSTPSTSCTLRAAVMQLGASGGGTITL